MELNEYLFLIVRKKGTIFSIVAIVLILAVILTVIQPFKYGSSARVLVMQNNFNSDPYQSSRATEYLSNILSKVVYSNSFFENVLNSGYYVDKSYFGRTVKGQMKIWAETVSADSVSDSGIIALDVYHTNRNQAESISRAVVYALQTKHGLYHGGGDNVSIKIIDEPVTSNYPVKPDLILNLGLALALGLVFSLGYIYLFPDEKYNIRLIPKFSKRQNKQEVHAERFGEPAREEFESRPPLVEPETALENMPEIGQAAESEVNNNLSNDHGDDNNNYDDLDIHEEIAQQGSMKNIFGRPYQDDL